MIILEKPMSLPINITQLLKGQVVEWERLEFKEGWNPLTQEDSTKARVFSRRYLNRRIGDFLLKELKLTKVCSTRAMSNNGSALRDTIRR